MNFIIAAWLCVRVCVRVCARVCVISHRHGLRLHVWPVPRSVAARLHPLYLSTLTPALWESTTRSEAKERKRVDLSQNELKQPGSTIASTSASPSILHLLSPYVEIQAVENVPAPAGK